MQIRSKEQFLSILEACEVLELTVTYDKGHEDSTVHVFKHNGVLTQSMDGGDLSSAEESGGTRQNMENGEWFEASEIVKSSVREAIKEVDFKAKVKSGEYTVCKATHENGIYDVVNDFELNYSSLDVSRRGFILVRKTKDENK